MLNYQHYYPIFRLATPCVSISDSSRGDYQGTISVTTSGATCDRWDRYGYRNMTHNYCRNHGNSAAVWCYVRGEQETCDVSCREECFEDKGSVLLRVFFSCWCLRLTEYALEGVNASLLPSMMAISISLSKNLSVQPMRNRGNFIWNWHSKEAFPGINHSWAHQRYFS